MGRMKHLDFLRRARNDTLGPSVGGLEDIAAKLGGEIADGKILCASPGKPRTDRSCAIRIDPTRPATFFIYGCDGPIGRAYAAVRAALELSEPDELAAHEKRQVVLKLWAETVPARGTIVEAYLNSRGIEIAPPETLRFHPNLYHAPSQSTWPAMVAERADARGDLAAIHRTYLSSDGLSKAPVEPQRMELGAKSGSAIRLAPVAEELLIGEGVETTLSVMQETGRPGWAAGSAKDLTLMELPPTVRSVVILADGDDVGEAAATRAAARWMIEGRHVRIARAERGLDFNDMLVAGADNENE